MKPPLFVRPSTDEERAALRAGLRSPDAFTLRRCQALLAGADGLRPSQVAERFGCVSQDVRNAIRAFAAEGLDRLRAKSHRPLSVRPEIDAAGCEQLRDPLHRSSRDFGRPTSLWRSAAAAEVAFARGITAGPVSDETIRQALIRPGVGWKRAKTWITSPDPAYLRKEDARDRLFRLAETRSDWVLGFQDEVWWSRLARPDLRAWPAPSRCGWTRSPPTPRTATPRPWPATACCGATPGR